MKKISYILLAVCSLAASCTKTDEPAPASPRNSEQVAIGASIESGYETPDGTRVSIDNTTGKTSWQAGDRIGIKVASDNSAQTDMLSTEDCRIFCGTIASPTYGTGDRIYAAYPASAIGSGSATFTIDSNQNGTLPQPMMTAVHEVAQGSSAADIKLGFRQAGALLMLTTDTKMDGIVVSAIASEDVAGTYTYDFGSGTAACSGSKSISIVPQSQTVFIHMPAVSFSKGICLTLTRNGERMIQSYSSVTALEAGKAYSLGTLTFKPVGVTLGDVTTSYTNNGAVAKTNDIGGSEMRFGQCSFTGISNAMVAEAGIEYNGKQAPAALNGKTFAPAALSSLSWTTYTVRAFVRTLAGETIYSDAKTAIVTGIPYTAAPPATSSWSTDNAAAWNSCLILKVSNAYALSPSFNVPTTSINVNTTVLAYAYGGSIPYNYKPSIYVSGSNTGTPSGSATTLSGSMALPGTAGFTSVARNISLSPSVPKICIYAEGKKGSSISTNPNGVVIKSVEIKYDI